MMITNRQWIHLQRRTCRERKAEIHTQATSL